MNIIYRPFSLLALSNWRLRRTPSLLGHRLVDLFRFICLDLIFLRRFKCSHPGRRAATALTLPTCQPFECDNRFLDGFPLLAQFRQHFHDVHMFAPCLIHRPGFLNLSGRFRFQNNPGGRSASTQCCTPFRITLQAFCSENRTRSRFFPFDSFRNTRKCLLPPPVPVKRQSKTDQYQSKQRFTW